MSTVLAIVKIGGKQHKIQPGDKIKVERLKLEEGKTASIKEVLFWDNGEETKVGNPFIKGAKVEIKSLGEKKARKVITIKHKPKKRQKKKIGHRQVLTEIEINSIVV